MEERSQLLDASPWIAVEDGDMDPFFDGCECREYHKGHIFYRQEENSDYVYLIRKGRVCFSVDGDNGETKGVFIADHGFIFGKLSLFDPMPNCCFAIVVSDDASVVHIPKKLFMQRLESDTAFCMKVMGMMTRTIRTLISEIRILSFKSARAKVCHTLYHLIAQYSTRQDDGSYLINMTFTHQEVGELIGLSRVSVSNILSQLVKDGIIDRKDGCYRVRDRDAVLLQILDDVI